MFIAFIALILFLNSFLIDSDQFASRKIVLMFMLLGYKFTILSKEYIFWNSILLSIKNSLNIKGNVLVLFIACIRQLSRKR